MRSVSSSAPLAIHACKQVSAAHAHCMLCLQVCLISHSAEFCNALCQEQWAMDAGNLTVSGASEAANKEMAKSLLEQERPTTMIDALGNVSCPACLMCV